MKFRASCCPTENSDSTWTNFVHGSLLIAKGQQTKTGRAATRPVLDSPEPPWRAFALSTRKDTPKNRQLPKVDRNQLGLYYHDAPDDTPTLVLKLRRIDWRVTTLDKDAWTQVREAACAIFFCGLKDGCTASPEALLRVANSNRPDPIIGSVPTLKRVLAKGRDLGLLRSTPQTNSKGNAHALRSVDESTVDALLELTLELEQETSKKPEENESRDPHLIPTRSSLDPHRLYTKNHLAKEAYSSKRSTDDRKSDWTEQQIAIVRDHARRLTQHDKLGTVGRGDQGRWNRDLLCKAIYLCYTRRVISEHALNDSIEAVLQVKPAKRWAYLHSTLARSLAYQRHGWTREDFEADQAKRNTAQREFNQALARIVVPDELLEPLAKRDDLSQRLCVGGDA